MRVHTACSVRLGKHARTHAHTHTAMRTCSHACGTKSKIHKHDVNRPACALVWMYIRTDGRAGGRRDGWMDGWMDECMLAKCLCMRTCIRAFRYVDTDRSKNLKCTWGGRGRERESESERSCHIFQLPSHNIYQYVCMHVCMYVCIHTYRVAGYFLCPHDGARFESS